MKYMKYKEWLNKLSEESEEKLVQIRMMSSGDDLCVGISPAYGVYIAENETEDEIHARREAGTRTSLGGGFQMTAPIEFYVRDAPIYGHVIKRVHNSDQNKYSGAKIVGYSFSLKGADRIAYNEAQKAGDRLAKLIESDVVDETPQDLGKYAGSEDLKLEDRVYNYKARVGV